MADASAGDPVDDQNIGGEEYVLRRVHPDLAKTGKPESSIFRDDPGGIGTSVTLWRSAGDLAIVAAGKDHVGVVAITVAELRAVGLGLMFTFEEGNPNHCEVFGPRTTGKMRALRNKVRWVRHSNPFPEEAKGETFQLCPF